MPRKKRATAAPPVVRMDLRLPAAQHETLRSYSEIAGVSMNDIVCSLIQFLDEYGTASPDGVAIREHAEMTCAYGGWRWSSYP